MRRISHFHEFPWEEWPDPRDLKPFFSPRAWIHGTVHDGNDNFGFVILGLDGQEGAPYGQGPSRTTLYLTGEPSLGVTLQYDRWRKQTATRECYVSRGDLTQLLTHIRSLHGSPLSCGLFVPFEQAWLATKQFLDSDGELPTAIEWLDPATLPKEAFPEP